MPRGRPKLIPKIEVQKVVEVIETPPVKSEDKLIKSEDENELEKLMSIREEMLSRKIHDVGTLGVFIEQLRIKIQSR